MKTSKDHNPIVVRKEGKQVVLFRGTHTSKYDISTNIMYTIEVVTGTRPAGETDVKVKQDNNEIEFQYRSHEDWDGIWGGDLVAIEYPNKDLWSEHPILNELKLTSLVQTAGRSEESSDSKDNYLIFPNKE